MDIPQVIKRILKILRPKKQHLLNGSSVVLCPRCGSPVVGMKHSFVDWNDKKRRFDVRLAFYCSPCHHRFDEEAVKSLPFEIARNSNCSCGSQLRLSDFTIRQINDDIEFEGTYVCPSCELKKRSLFGFIRSTLEELWSDTKRVEVGASGIKYERESRKRNR